MSGCMSTTSVWKRARIWFEFCPEIPFAIHVGCSANCGPSCPEPQIAVIESPRNTTMGVVECPIGVIGVLLTPQPEAKSRAVAVMARVLLRCLQGCRWSLLRVARSGLAMAWLGDPVEIAWVG